MRAALLTPLWTFIVSQPCFLTPWVLLCCHVLICCRSHCYDQKQEFGAAAMAEFPYVECFPQGWKKVGTARRCCVAAAVEHHMLA
jgi:hypothetical protein